MAAQTPKAAPQTRPCSWAGKGPHRSRFHLTTTTTRYPLIIVLHGYGADGLLQANYLGLYSRVDNKQYVLVVPDGTIDYDGGEILAAPYPGAIETAERFAVRAGCDIGAASMGANRDLIENIDGAETSVVEIPACAAGVDLQLWTLGGAPHIPFPWVESGLDAFVDWIINHPRP